MIFDCYENRINIVLVKTISRFARNTVDLLETVSRLKSLGWRRNHFSSGKPPNQQKSSLSMV